METQQGTKQRFEVAPEEGDKGRNQTPLLSFVVKKERNRKGVMRICRYQAVASGVQKVRYMGETGTYHINLI